MLMVRNTKCFLNDGSEDSKEKRTRGPSDSQRLREGGKEERSEKCALNNPECESEKCGGGGGKRWGGTDGRGRTDMTAAAGRDRTKTPPLLDNCYSVGKICRWLVNPRLGIRHEVP